MNRDAVRVVHARLCALAQTAYRFARPQSRGGGAGVGEGGGVAGLGCGWAAVAPDGRCRRRASASRSTQVCTGQREATAASQVTVPVNNLAAGMYFVSIKDEKHIKVLKLLKQ
jgi:hypothetical protein